MDGSTPIDDSREARGGFYRRLLKDHLTEIYGEFLASYRHSICQKIGFTLQGSLERQIPPTPNLY